MSIWIGVFLIVIRGVHCCLFFLGINQLIVVSCKTKRQIYCRLCSVKLSNSKHLTEYNHKYNYVVCEKSCHGKHWTLVKQSFITHANCMLIMFLLEKVLWVYCQAAWFGKIGQSSGPLGWGWERCWIQKHPGNQPHAPSHIQNNPNIMGNTLCANFLSSKQWIIIKKKQEEFTKGKNTSLHCVKTMWLCKLLSKLIPWHNI